MNEEEQQLRKYIDFDYLNGLFDKYLKGFKISSQDICLSVYGLSRFRKDVLRSVVIKYLEELWRKELLFTHKGYY